MQYGGGEYLHCVPVVAVVNFVASGWYQMESSGCMISTLCTQQPRKHSSRDCRSSPSHPASPCHIKARRSAVNKNSLSRSSFYHQLFSSASISSASKHVRLADWVQIDWKLELAAKPFINFCIYWGFPHFSKAAANESLVSTKGVSEISTCQKKRNKSHCIIIHFTCVHPYAQRIMHVEHMDQEATDGRICGWIDL